jgi:hypothetical protein
VTVGLGLFALGVALWNTGPKDGLWHALGPNLVALGGGAVMILAAYGSIADRRRRRRESVVEELLKAIKIAVKADEDDDLLTAKAATSALAQELDRSLPVLEIARQVGLTSYHRDRPTHHINELVIGAHKTVDILEISLNSMRSVSAARWSECKVKPRIILLDPHFPTVHPLALQRDAEEREQPGTILREIIHFLGNVPTDWFYGEPRIKLAETMPTVSYFRIDDVAYVSPYVHQKIGDETLHLELSEGGVYFAAMSRHFEALWADDERVKPAHLASIPPTYP